MHKRGLSEQSYTFTYTTFAYTYTTFAYPYTTYTYTYTTYTYTYASRATWRHKSNKRTERSNTGK